MGEIAIDNGTVGSIKCMIIDVSIRNPSVSHVGAPNSFAKIIQSVSILGAAARYPVVLLALSKV